MIKTQTIATNYFTDAYNVSRKSHAKYEFNTFKDKFTFKVHVAMKYAADLYCPKQA